MKDSYQISIIIPVYNAGRYLRRAMDSLIRQTVFDTMEIIAVNDGSSDSSGAVLEEYAALHPNIRTYHTKNCGVSSTRNLGMEKASAMYIGFMDADDWVDEDYYEKMLSAIESSGADMAVCGFCMETDGGVLTVNPVPADMTVYTEENAVKAFFLGQIDVHAVTKIYRTALVQDLRYDTSLHYGEDRLFVLASLLKAHDVVLVQNCYYHYYLNEQSAMNQKLSPRSFENLVVGRKTMDIVSRQNPVLIPYAECADIIMKCRLLGEIVTQHGKREYWHEYQQLKNDIRQFSLQKAYHHSSRKHIISLLIAKCSPVIYGVLRKNPLLRFKK